MTKGNSREGTLHMLSHYTGNYMLRARGPIEDGSPEQADAQRTELISKLEKLEQIPEVVSCIKYLQGVTWRSHDDVDNFYTFYTETNPREKELGDLIKKLFGHR